MAHRPFHVLFLCTGNSARSIMAEAIISRMGQGHFIGHSAGSHPKGEVHPFARALLERLNHDVSGMRSKSWNEFAAAGAPELDFVFTVCDDAAKEVCPFWPGQPISAHWPVPDPVRVEGDDAQRALAFADAYRMLSNRIAVFCALPLHELDRVALQHRLDQIGRDAAGVPAGGRAA
jgi:protein-tyrosine-phosphatase